MQRELCQRIAQTLATAPVHDHLGYEALAYAKLPGPDYYYVLHLLHAAIRPKLYVEIGVRDGKSLALAHSQTRCVAIDPKPKPEMLANLRPNIRFACSTSDKFFADETNRETARGFDLAFIDGDHSFEQALRDFENLEALAHEGSLILLHDVIPMDERTSTPVAQTSFHTGDVWRLMGAIVKGRKDLTAFTIACPPTGLGVIGNLRSDTGTSEFFGEWVDEFGCSSFDPDWNAQVEMLNIIPNEGPAIAAALQKGMAA